MAATRTRAKEELAAAPVTARKAAEDKGAALSALNLATAEYNVAKGSAAEALAMDNVSQRVHYGGYWQERMMEILRYKSLC